MPLAPHVDRSTKSVMLVVAPTVRHVGSDDYGTQFNRGDCTVAWSTL